MCDLLDDPGGISVPPSSRKSSNAESLGLTLGNFIINHKMMILSYGKKETINKKNFNII